MSYRAGFVGLIGLPNSGKSTLMNALVGEKVSIVTNKPQTTRRRVMGLVSEKDFQAVIVDAPGVVQAKSGLNTFLREEAQDVMSQVDVIGVVLNIDEDSPEHLDEVLEMVKAQGKPWFAVIHKDDLPLVHRPQILRDKLTKYGVPILQGSALKQPESLRESICEVVAGMLPNCDAPLFDADLFTLSTTRELCAEIVREKCFESLHQEVPFGLAVKILKFDEDSGPLVRIFSEIWVAKENHRAIVIGRQGSVLKEIGTKARQEIEKLIDRRVFLDLKVASRRNWQKNPSIMKELGYVVPKA